MKKALYFICCFCILFLFCSGDSGLEPDNNAGNGNQNGETAPLDRNQTIESLNKEGNVYTMSFYGDYKDILKNEETLKYSLSGKSAKPPYFCSLFTTSGDSGKVILGRNFDSIDAGILLYKCKPSDGYASIALTPTWHFGFDKGAALEDLSLADKSPLLNAPYYPVDGINEQGVAVGIASVRTVSIQKDPEKNSVFITHLVRKILDYAANVDIAIRIAQTCNVYLEDVNTQGCHIIIADKTGDSAILEWNNTGEMEVLRESTPFQVLTNIVVNGVSVNNRRSFCWRYNTIYGALTTNNGNAPAETGISILESVHLTGELTPTIWSSVYDLDKFQVHICRYRDYNSTKIFSLDDY